MRERKERLGLGWGEKGMGLMSQGPGERGCGWKKRGAGGGGGEGGLGGVVKGLPCVVEICRMEPSVRGWDRKGSIGEDVGRRTSSFSEAWV